MKKILVVDDSATNNILLSAVLDSTGYQFEVAKNALEAFRFLEFSKFDMVLLDLLMPEINGFDFLKTIRADESTKNLPVIVVSAATDIENKRKALELGANSFINKPIDIEILLDEMKKFLN